ncbi:hypothetical protein H4582DRAFT_2014380, partial [Lactarius indigo]
RWFTPCAVVDASLSAPRPAALDILLMFGWVLVAGERRVRFVESAPPDTLIALGLPLLLRTSRFTFVAVLVASQRTTITVGFIPLVTALPVGRRWGHLRRDHHGQRFRRHCEMVEE